MSAPAGAARSASAAYPIPSDSLPLRVAQEADDRRQLRSAGRFQPMDAHQRRADVAGAFVAVVVDPEEPRRLAPHLQPVPAPQRRLRGRVVAGRVAQDRGIVRDQRDQHDGGRRDHVTLPRCHWRRRGVGVDGRGHLAARLRADPGRPPKKPPAAGGATITWILSLSLSASVFWISSGFFAISSRLARHLLALRLAGDLDAVRVGVGELAARVRLGARLQSCAPRPRLRHPSSADLARLRLQPALLNLLLLQRQDVFHRLLARLGGDQLLRPRLPPPPSRAGSWRRPPPAISPSPVSPSAAA